MMEKHKDAIGMRINAMSEETIKLGSDMEKRYRDIQRDQ